MDRAAVPDPPGLISGKLVVLASIVIFAIIGVAFWAAGKWFNAHPIESDDTLDYADRSEWIVMPATTILLTEPPRYMRGPYGSKIKKELPFTLTPEDERFVSRLSGIAGGEVVGSVNSLTGQHAASLFHGPAAVQFYADWLRANSLVSSGERWAALEEAIASAPAVLSLTFVTSDGRRFIHEPIGAIELTFARKADGVLDDSLRLHYPDNITDEFGRVYLPVFDTPLQVSVKPDPPGYEAEYPFSGWLIFPGKIGGPEPIVVRPKAE